MVISEMINKLTLMLKDFGNHPIEIHCDKDGQKITAAMWNDVGDPVPYINAVTMPKKEQSTISCDNKISQPDYHFLYLGSMNLKDIKSCDFRIQNQPNFQGFVLIPNEDGLVKIYANVRNNDDNHRNDCTARSAERRAW